MRKAHYALKAGDILTFPQGSRIRVVRILTMPERRGPAAEARLCYEDLEPGETPQDVPESARSGTRNDVGDTP